MNVSKLSNCIVESIKRPIQKLPQGFHDTFKYTVTGNNMNHPITIGIITKALLGLSSSYGIAHIAYDLRLNKGNGCKFQPDITCMDKEYNPIAFVDYESPNSSDARIPQKDIDQYQRWSSECGENLPYIIITSLPNKDSSKWRILYTGKGKYNEEFKDKKDQIQRNPFKFWYALYNKHMKKKHMLNISFINISGNDIKTIKMAKNKSNSQFPNL